MACAAAGDEADRQDGLSIRCVPSHTVCFLLFPFFCYTPARLRGRSVRGSCSVQRIAAASCRRDVGPIFVLSRESDKVTNETV